MLVSIANRHFLRCVQPTSQKIGKIFEPFFTTKIAPRGTGLGLPIAKKIVEEEGGTIDLNSTKGAGTAVTLLYSERADSVNSLVGRMSYEGAFVELLECRLEFLLRVHDDRPIPRDWFADRPARDKEKAHG